MYKLKAAIIGARMIANAGHIPAWVNLLRPLTLVTNMGRYQVDVTPKVPAGPYIPFYAPWYA